MYTWCQLKSLHCLFWTHQMHSSGQSWAHVAKELQQSQACWRFFLGGSCGTFCLYRICWWVRAEVKILYTIPFLQERVENGKNSESFPSAFFHAERKHTSSGVDVGTKWLSSWMETEPPPSLPLLWERWETICFQEHDFYWSPVH